MFNIMRGARRGAKYLFLPGFVPLARMTKWNAGVPIHAMARLLAALRLLPADHAALAPASVGHVNVLALVKAVVLDWWHQQGTDLRGVSAPGSEPGNLVWWSRLWKWASSRPQVIAQGGILLWLVSALALAAIEIAVLLLSTLISVAHAAAPGATDLALQALNSVFPMSSGLANTLQGAYATLISGISVAALMIALAMFIYGVVSIIIDAATKPDSAGSRHNIVWFIIRGVVALLLLVPLASGFNGGQYIIHGLVKWGSDKATTYWQGFAGVLSNPEQLVLKPTIIGLDTLVHDVFVAEVCSAVVTARAEAANSPERGVVREAPNGKITYNVEIVATTGLRFGRGAVRTGACGEVNFNGSSGVASGSGTDSIRRAHKQALREAVEAPGGIRALAVNYAQAKLSGSADRPAPDLAVEAARIVEAYRGRVASQIDQAAGTQNRETRQQAGAAAGVAGWAGAGAWFQTIARMNTDFSEAARVLPSVTPPRDPVEPVARLISEANKDWQAAAAVRPDAFPVAAMARVGGGGWFDEFLGQIASLGVSILTFDGANPLIDMIKLGSALSYIGFGIFILAGLASLAGNSVMAWGYNALAWSGAVPDIKEIIRDFWPVIYGLGGFFLLSGALLCIVLPMIPYIRMLFALVTWLLHVLEAVVLWPLLALAMVTTEGGGLFGPTGRNGALIILSAVVRPILSVAGLIGGYLVFNAGISVLNATMVPAIRGAAASGGANLMGFVGYAAMYVVLAYIVANVAFKSVDTLPNAVSRWIGGNATGEREDLQHATGILVNFGRNIQSTFQRFRDRRPGRGG